MKALTLLARIRRVWMAEEWSAYVEGKEKGRRCMALIAVAMVFFGALLGGTARADIGTGQVNTHQSLAKGKRQPTLSQIDRRVAELIEKTVKRRTEKRAFADLEALGCQSVPAIVKRMDDRRRLTDPAIALTNRFPGAFEGKRFYGPKLVVDALAAILNQITGHDFGSIENGGTDAERRKAVDGWRDFVSKTPASKLCD